MKLLIIIHNCFIIQSWAFYSYKFITNKLTTIFNKRDYINNAPYYNENNYNKTTTRIYPNRFKHLKNVDAQYCKHCIKRIEFIFFFNFSFFLSKQ